MAWQGTSCTGVEKWISCGCMNGASPSFSPAMRYRPGREHPGVACTRRTAATAVASADSCHNRLNVAFLAEYFQSTVSAHHF